MSLEPNAMDRRVTSDGSWHFFKEDIGWGVDVLFHVCFSFSLALV
jgi:hypothetical protein